MTGAVLTGISVSLLFLSMGLLVLSIWKKEKLTSEAAWEKILKRPLFLKVIFALSFVSLLVYVIAESAELLWLQSPSIALEGIHENGETIHLFIMAIALIAAIPLFSEILGGEDGN